jgi:hypothetical protein
LTSGTVHSTLHADDVVKQSIAIGFTFPFAGSTYTQLAATSNGWISLSNGSSGTQTNSSGNANTYGPVLMPLWDDLHGSAGTATSLTTGTAPNRVFTMEWKSWKWYYNSTGSNVISFQAKLYESGRVEFHYSQGPDPISGSTPSATIGIAKTNLDYQTLTNSSASPTISTSTFITSITTKPATGQVYAWDVPCQAPSGIAATNVTNKAADINWNAVTNSQGYEYVVSQSSTPPTGAGSPTNSTFLPLNNLSNGTTYYVFIRNKCGASVFSQWATYSFTTVGCFKPSTVLISNVTDTSADVLWSLTTGSDYYQYSLSFSSQNPVTGIVTTPTNTVHFNNLTPNSKYYLHTRSRCFGTDSSAWRVDSFVTQMACYAPNVQVNLMGTNTPYAFWEPVPTAVGYEYTLTNSNYSPAFGTSTKATNASLTLPNDGLAYYLHVRSKCNSMFTFSPWTSMLLREGSTTGIANVNSGGVLSVYPNPAHNVLTLDGVATGVKYEITDLTGRVQLAGVTDRSTSTMDISGLPAAVYMLRLSGQDGTVNTIKFAKQ